MRGKLGTLRSCAEPLALALTLLGCQRGGSLRLGERPAPPPLHETIAAATALAPQAADELCRPVANPPQGSNAAKSDKINPAFAPAALAQLASAARAGRDEDKRRLWGFL